MMMHERLIARTANLRRTHANPCLLNGMDGMAWLGVQISAVHVVMLFVWSTRSTANRSRCDIHRLLYHAVDSTCSFIMFIALCEIRTGMMPSFDQIEHDTWVMDLAAMVSLLAAACFWSVLASCALYAVWSTFIGPHSRIRELGLIGNLLARTDRAMRALLDEDVAECLSAVLWFVTRPAALTYYILMTSRGLHVMTGVAKLIWVGISMMIALAGLIEDRTGGLRVRVRHIHSWMILSSSLFAGKCGRMSIRISTRACPGYALKTSWK